MFEAGLGVTYHIPTVKTIQKNVEWKREAYSENGRNYIKTSMITPVGEIFTIEEDGWTQKYWLETKEDYKVMTYIIKNTQLKPDYKAFLAKEEEIKPYGGAVATGRTLCKPYWQTSRLENFSYHLFDYDDDLAELYDDLLHDFTSSVDIMAEGPGRFVSVLENFTAETMGPIRFKQYHVPVYEKLFPILQSSGKIVGTHYDGKLEAVRIWQPKLLINRSLTPPPEGDMTLEQCRAAWPDKLFWSNINVSNYYLPAQELKELVADLVKQAAPDGRRLAFEISEQYPDNWKESIPVVLEALNEIKL